MLDDEERGMRYSHLNSGIGYEQSNVIESSARWAEPSDESDAVHTWSLYTWLLFFTIFFLCAAILNRHSCVESDDDDQERYTNSTAENIIMEYVKRISEKEHEEMRKKLILCLFESEQIQQVRHKD